MAAPVPPETREAAVNAVRQGMSFREAARTHGVSECSVTRWCRAADVSSIHLPGNPLPDVEPGLPPDLSVPESQRQGDAAARYVAGDESIQAIAVAHGVRVATVKKWALSMNGDPVLRGDGWWVPDPRRPMVKRWVPAA